MEFLAHYLPGSLFSFLYFHYMTRDELPVKAKLPKIKFKMLEISPNIRIHTNKNIIHVHHWISLGLMFLVSIPIHNALLDANFTKGFFVGGIVQGLMIPNSGKIVYPKEEVWLTIQKRFLENTVIKYSYNYLKKTFRS